MDRLSIDYASLVRDLGTPMVPAVVGPALLDAFGWRYEDEHEVCSLLTFEQSGACYLFDFASEVGAPRDDRTVAAWTVTPAVVGWRDVSYQRGFPLPPDPDGTEVGEFGPNIFRQQRSLNRGWSPEGKRYRALEREAAATPGTFYFGHLRYADDTDYPAMIEAGLLRGGTLHVEVFINRQPPAPPP